MDVSKKIRIVNELSSSSVKQIDFSPKSLYYNDNHSQLNE